MKSEPDDRLIENNQSPRGVERDVLLAASGELSWARRLLLRFRLSRDPAARRLAETLCLVELAVGDEACMVQPRTIHRFGLPGLAIAACLLLAAIGWQYFDRTAEDGKTLDAAIVLPLRGSSNTPPLFERSQRLAHRSVQPPATPLAFASAASSRSDGGIFEAPRLPLWSRARGLDAIPLRDRR